MSKTFYDSIIFRGLIGMVFAVFLFVPIVTAVEYTVGPGGTYENLEALRRSGLLQDGDTIVLNGDDNSLTNSLTNSYTTINLTLLGTGSIIRNPSSSFGGPFFSSGYGTLTLGSNDPDYSESIDISNFTSRAISTHIVNILGGTNSFSSNTAGSDGGALYVDDTVISGGTNTFSDNSSRYAGGAIYAFGNVVISDGINSFSNNKSDTHIGGAMYVGYTTTISGGENTFSGNSASSNGGAIYNVRDVTISGGTNSFSSNTAGSGGGAILALGTLSISGGTNMFSDNKASTTAGYEYGGALSAGTVILSGGTNTFTGNSSCYMGGAIASMNNLTLRASDGDFTFRGNKDNVGKVGEKANAIYANSGPMLLAAGEGRSIYFYDPITTDTNTNRSININPLATDTGRIVFDGSDYAGLALANRHSAVYGNTTVGYGELVMNGNVTYGAVNNSGSFTLGQNATLSSAFGNNQIRANRITMNGTVDIANGGKLELATAGTNAGSFINGTVSFGLGIDSFGSLSAIGNLTFGANAVASLYWGDSYDSLYDGWTQDYAMGSLFSATGTMTGFGNLMFDASWFDAYDGFSYTLENGILTLSYTAAEVPEPATLLMLGLAAASLPVVRRLRKK